MTELKLTLPWPPSINSMYSQGIIGAKRNLEEPFVAVLKELVDDAKCTTVAEVLAKVKDAPGQVRTMVKQAFGSPRASMFLSDAGKAYRELAREAIQVQRVPRGALHGRLKVAVVAYPPDARVRDLDNLWKSALDVLKNNQVIPDDGHFDEEHIRRSHQVKGGSFVVTIGEIAEAFDSRQQGLELPPAQAPASAPNPF